MANEIYDVHSHCVTFEKKLNLNFKGFFYFDIRVDKSNLYLIEWVTNFKIN